MESRNSQLSSKRPTRKGCLGSSHTHRLKAFVRSMYNAASVAQTAQRKTHTVARWAMHGKSDIRWASEGS
jgi:hypothetical protein